MRRLIVPALALIVGIAAFSDQALAQNQVSEPLLQWMAWTWQTAAFFGVIACALVVMTIWEIVRPGGNPRNPGILGISTTRGDRLFISLLSAAYIHLGWLGLMVGLDLAAPINAVLLAFDYGSLGAFPAPLWGATAISLILMLAVFRWV